MLIKNQHEFKENAVQCAAFLLWHGICYMLDVRKGRKGWQMEIEDVVNVVAAVFDVPARQILEGGENRGARDAAIFLARKHLDLCYLHELEQVFRTDRKTIVEKSFSHNLKQEQNFNFKEELAFADEEVRRLRCRGHSYPAKHKDRQGHVNEMA